MGTYSPYSGTGIAFDTPAVGVLLSQINEVIKTAASLPGARALMADVAPLFEGKGFQFTNIALGDTRPNSDASAAIAQALMRTLETGRPELFAPAPSERLGR